MLALLIAAGAFWTAHRQLRILSRQEADRQARERQADAATDHEFRLCRSVAGPSGSRDMATGTAEVDRQAADAGYAPDWLSLLPRRELLCAIRFRDASNQWWTRDVDGVLAEATARSLPGGRAGAA